jgi:hypothetical protein
VDNYFTVEDPFLSAKQPGKQPPLNMPISPILFSLLLALEIAAATALPISDA